MPDVIWDVVFTTRDGEDFKARVKNYTFRDGLNKTQLEGKLIKTVTGAPDNADRDIALLYLVNNYPLLRFGLEAAEGFALPLRQDVFWKLPEMFVLEVAEAIREVNPQYGIPFLELRKAMEKASTTPSAPPSEPTATSDGSVKTG